MCMKQPALSSARPKPRPGCLRTRSLPCAPPRPPVFYSRQCMTPPKPHSSRKFRPFVIFTFPPFPRLHTLSEHSVFGQKAADVQIAQHAFRRNGKKRTKSHRFAAKKQQNSDFLPGLCVKRLHKRLIYDTINGQWRKKTFTGTAAQPRMLYLGEATRAPR